MSNEEKSEMRKGNVHNAMKLLTKTFNQRYETFNQKYEKRGSPTE